MKRLMTILAVLAMVSTTPAKILAQKPASTQSKNTGDTESKAQREAAARFYSMQAALFSALAHAEALDRITGDPGTTDFVLARTLISSGGREIQGANTSSVSLGKTINSLEKTDAMKMMREQLQKALESMDEAQAAADGHGTISPKAKSAVASLTRALEATVLLAEDLGIEAMSAPGAQAIEDAKRGGLSPGFVPGRRVRSNAK